MNNTKKLYILSILILAYMATAEIEFAGNINYLWNYSIKNNDIINSYIVPDLNGDGINDTVIITYKYDLNTGIHYYNFIAKKGIDGKYLWNYSIKGNKYLTKYSIIDLNGDKLHDIILTVKDSSSSTLIAKIGKNGSTLWQEEGYILDDELPRWPKLNEFPIAKDLDGDKKNDILLTTRDSSHYILKAKRGVDGKDLWKEIIDGYGLVHEYFSGDFNGDGLDDILLIMSNSTHYILKAKIGKNGTDLWKETTPGSLQGSYIIDADGDKLNDVLIITRNFNFATWSSILKVRKGINGEELWRINGEWLEGYSVGDLNGDRLGDILVFNRSRYNSTHKIYSLKAKIGKNGSTLWQENIYRPNIIDSSLNLYGESMGDLNGDRLNDILFVISDYDRRNDTSSITLKAKIGKNGSTLWQENIKGHDIWLYRSSIGDVNGDRLNDILFVTSDYDRRNDTTRSILKVKKGINGIDMWRKNIVGYMFGYSIGDLNGDRLNDIAVVMKARTFNALLVNNGKNGTNIWRAESYDKVFIYDEESGLIICSSNLGGGLGIITFSAGDINGDNYDDMLLKYDNKIYAATYRK